MPPFYDVKDRATRRVVRNRLHRSLSPRLRLVYLTSIACMISYTVFTITYYFPSILLNLSPHARQQQLRAYLMDQSTILHNISFPNIIWQTSPRTPPADTQDYLNVDSWISKNPDFTHTLLTDSAAKAYFDENYINSTTATCPDRIYLVDRAAELKHLFTSFTQRILAVDLLRYLLLYNHGGVYTDIDTFCQQPIHTWLSSTPNFNLSQINVVIGLAQPKPDVHAHSNISFLTHTLFAKPGHEIFARMLDVIIDVVEEDLERLDWGINDAKDLWYSNDNIIEHTGSAMFTKVVKEYIHDLLGASYDLQEEEELYTEANGFYTVSMSSTKDAEEDDENEDGEQMVLTGGKVIGDILFLPTVRWDTDGKSGGGGLTNMAFSTHEMRGSWRRFVWAPSNRGAGQ